MNRLDIVIAGVGGQGTVLASRILAQAALNSGLSARTSETIGMAQREGSVQSHIRIGTDAFGPVIPKGQADILIGFEPAEAVRATPLLKPNGLLLVNDQSILPVTVTLGTSIYTIEAVNEFLKKHPAENVLVNAFEKAVAAGNYRAVNSVMLGALSRSGRLPFSSKELLRALLDLVPSRAREINRKAFEMGAEL